MTKSLTVLKSVRREWYMRPASWVHIPANWLRAEFRVQRMRMFFRVSTAGYLWEIDSTEWVATETTWGARRM